jgi:phosphatidate cytidylyltransferase
VKEFGKRLSSGIIGIILLVLVVTKGGFYLSTSIFIISLIGLREFYKALNNLEIRPNELIGNLGTIAIFLANLTPGNSVDLVVTFIIITLLISTLFEKDTKIQDISATLLGILYVPFLIFHVSYLDGTNYIWLVFIIAFGTDTFAYLAGNLFGKRKLCPTISPKKTIEGSIGGVIGSLFLTIIFAIVMEINPLWKLMILSILTSIISQLGDLVASKIKRIAKIKDYGFIMPGHGGILDRFDSIILAAPVIYYYVKYFL